MKTIILISFLLSSVFAMAQKPAGKNTNPALSTNMKFDGLTVGGKVQAPLESLTVVENEKEIDDLIGVRKDFKDRSLKAKGLR